MASPGGQEGFVEDIDTRTGKDVLVEIGLRPALRRAGMLAWRSPPKLNILEHLD